MVRELAQIALLLYQLITGQVSLAQAFYKLAGELQFTSKEHSEYAIESNVKPTYQIVNDGAFGNYALKGLLDALLVAVAGVDAPILAAIAALPVGSDLPAGGVDWSVVPPGGDYPAGDALQYAARLALNLSEMGGFPMQTWPGFGIFGKFSHKRWAAGAWMNLEPDWSDIRADDTRYSWLVRSQPALTWNYWVQADGTVQPWVSGSGGSGGDPDFRVVPLFTETDFETWKALKFRLPSAAPVWPGLANVTLGTPVALSSDLTVAGPLDGLIVSITTPPTALGKFAFGGFTAYYKVGEISFISDNGDAEPWQYLAFDQALYCPKAMNRAASASLRVLAGAAGLATPWVVT